MLKFRSGFGDGARFSMGRLGRLCLVHLARLHVYKRYSLPWAHLGIDANRRLPGAHAEMLGALGRAVPLRSALLDPVPTY